MAGVHQSRPQLTVNVLTNLGGTAQAESFLKGPVVVRTPGTENPPQSQPQVIDRTLEASESLLWYLLAGNAGLE
jgi:hypothetical protein